MSAVSHPHGVSVTGVVEHGGIPVPPRPDAVPPPHWRLEAIAAVERPRQPDIRSGRVAFVLDRDSSDIWTFEIGAPEHAGEVVPERWTTDRALTAYWEDTGPRLSPDGATLAYTNGEAIWLTDGAVARKLCEASSPVWIDDGRLVVEIDRPSAAEPHGRTVLGLVEVDAGWITPLVEMEGDVGEVAVAPDGSKLVAVHSPRHDLNASRIVTISLDPTSLGELVELGGDPQMHDSGPAWSPGGDAIVFRSESSGWGEAHLWDVASGERRQLTEAEADFGEFAWSEHGMVAVRTRHGVCDLVTIDDSTGEVRVVVPGGMWASPTWIGPHRLFAAHEASDTAPRLVEVRLTGARPIVVDRVRPTPRQVRSAPHVRPEHLWYPAPGGEVPAFLYRPRAATADAPCPAIVHPHGGPTSHYGDEWDGIAQYFVDKGYAWLAPNFKGSTSYGRDHERANHGVWGVADMADCLAAHEWLAEQDWIDARRIGIFGASYGSYMALASVVDGDRFACAVAKYGDCDILTSWAQGDRVGRLDLERMMGHPTANPDGYRIGSPIHRIDSISAPILVAHGERDVRVHPAQSEELVEALRRIGATFDYVTYPTEGHGFLRREPFLDFYRRLERFLDWYLH